MPVHAVNFGDVVKHIVAYYKLFDGRNYDLPNKCTCRYYNN